MWCESLGSDYIILFGADDCKSSRLRILKSQNPSFSIVSLRKRGHQNWYDVTCQIKSCGLTIVGSVLVMRSIFLTSFFDMVCIYLIIIFIVTEAMAIRQTTKLDAGLRFGPRVSTSP